jgi:glycosyltransferase involved in cell wall biosynthesis
VAHFEWAQFASTWTRLFAGWRFPVVVSCHGSEVLVHPFTRRQRYLPVVFENATVVHCVSRAVRDAATASGLDPERARVIGSATSPDVFRPRQTMLRADGEFLVVSVGALRWVKGYEYAVAAIARLAAAGVPVRYEIAGDEQADIGEAGERERLGVVIHDLGIGSRVHLHGRLSEHEVVGLLARSDAFLQPSLSEGMPTAVLEAMACCVPVVASDVGGTREVIADGVEGLLVPARESAAAAEALARLWSDPGLRRSLGRAARERVVAEFALEQQLDRFESLYRSLAAA